MAAVIDFMAMSHGPLMKHRASKTVLQHPALPLRVATVTKAAPPRGPGSIKSIVLRTVQVSTAAATAAAAAEPALAPRARLLSTFEKGGRTYIRLRPDGVPGRRITRYKARGRRGRRVAVTRVSSLPLAVGADAPSADEEDEDVKTEGRDCRLGGLDGIGMRAGCLSVVRRHGRTYVRVTPLGLMVG